MIPKSRRSRLLAMLPLVLAMATGCDGPPYDSAAPDDMTMSKAMDASIYASAVANSERPPRDAERDEQRKPAKVLEFFEIRPGMQVLDLFSYHHAEAGAPRETGGMLHRIDPSLVIADLTSSGFEPEEKSDALRNMSDDHRRTVFDPELRGRTDRFMLRFRKPE